MSTNENKISNIHSPANNYIPYPFIKFFGQGARGKTFFSKKVFPRI